MADENMNTIHITEKQKVQEITDKLEEGIRQITRLPEKVSPPDRGGES